MAGEQVRVCLEKKKTNSEILCLTLLIDRKIDTLFVPVGKFQNSIHFKTQD